MKTSVLRRTSPLPQQGKRAREWAAIRRRIMPTLLERDGARCVACHRGGELDPAHMFGRPGSGACLGPIADRPELVALMCRRDHDAIDRGEDTELRDRLRWEAVARLAEAEGVEVPSDAETPVEAVRMVARLLEETR